MEIQDSDPEILSTPSLLVCTDQHEFHSGNISRREQMHISRALLSSKLENERAKRREIMFVSKMNTVGKAYDRAFELISVPEDGNCMYHAIQPP